MSKINNIPTAEWLFNKVRNYIDDTMQDIGKICFTSLDKNFRFEEKKQLQDDLTAKMFSIIERAFYYDKKSKNNFKYIDLTHRHASMAGSCW